MLYNVILCNVMYLLHSSVASVLIVKIIEEVLNIHVFIILMFFNGFFIVNFWVCFDIRPFHIDIDMIFPQRVNMTSGNAAILKGYSGF